VRLTIRQTLVGRTLDGKVCAFPVMDAKRKQVPQDGYRLQRA